jgi:integrase
MANRRKSRVSAPSTGVRVVALTDPTLTAHVLWMRLRRLSEATVELRCVAMRGLLRHAGAPALACTTAHLDAWQRALGVADASRASYVSQVASFYAWVLQEGLLDADPSLVLISPKLPRRQPRPISEDDLQLALAAAPPRIEPWLELAAYAGLRAGEIARLDRRDVLDHADPRLLVVMGKGGRERLVPLAPRVRDTLRRHGLPSAGLVFPRHDGQPGPNRPNLITQLSSAHLHSLGIPATLHCLRHRFLSEVYRESRDLRVTQELAGHASPTTTAGYAAWSPDRAVAAVLALDARRSA